MITAAVVEPMAAAGAAAEVVEEVVAAGPGAGDMAGIRSEPPPAPGRLRSVRDGTGDGPSCVDADGTTGACSPDRQAGRAEECPEPQSLQPEGPGSSRGLQ